MRFFKVIINCQFSYITTLVHEEDNVQWCDNISLTPTGSGAKKLQKDTLFGWENRSDIILNIFKYFQWLFKYHGFWRISYSEVLTVFPIVRLSACPSEQAYFVLLMFSSDCQKRFL